ncbi:hypothetical protein A9K55_001907 [Cordyceps militaris]|uniref:Uncharacterized protein n=1 Tax=Cordyceps militaris TaxID=73501 RepID=A0A2H4SQK8_CORMI|nr:hypothetical protein A9K55_001907 [Cordyceps militaris]
MKSTFALVGAYAAVAAAFTPGRHLHFPRANGTSALPSDAITTLTVQTTRTSTIISCAPTVTNCPAGKPEMSAIPESARQVQTVTETIDLTTTICPVSEASAISSSVIEKHNSATPIGSASSALAPTVTPTPTPAGALTTLTVKSTRTSTITSCAPTVTNCPVGKPEMSAIPESARQIKTVTETIDLTTTVCPITEASTISKKIIEQHKSSSASSALPSQQQPPLRTTDIISTKTITLTLGTGDRQSVVPTVITTTIKSTITPPASAEETVTTTATSTSTKTVTITRAKTTSTPAPVPGNNGNGGSGSNCEKCAAPATVTVTVAQTTITASAATVTVTAPCATGSVPVGGKQVEQEKPADKASQSKPAGGNVTTQPAASASATPCESDSTTFIDATVTVVPYPVNNGTTPTGAPSPSGFARLRR